MWWDTKFTPEEDGNEYERLWWHFVEADFPAWGTFWSHHIVPLTNRIVDDFKGTPQERLFIRSDPRIHASVEALLMSNYSVFYYLARSCAIVNTEPHLFLEDAFIFLRAAAENAAKFVGRFKSEIAVPFGMDKDEIKKLKDVNTSKNHVEIVDYRDAFVHWARLGRNPNLPWEFIPVHAHVARKPIIETKAKISWRFIQDLAEDQFIDGRKHLKTLQRGLMEELNPVWKSITRLMDQQRTNKKYLKYYRLEPSASGKLQPIKLP